MLSLHSVAGERSIRAIFALIGFTAAIAQIVLMRELMVVFGGNEASLGVALASWLLWTAAGSALLGRIKTPPRQTTAALETAIAAVLPLTILAVRTSKTALQRVPGEVVAPVPMLLTSLAALSVFCALSGWLFSSASRLWAGVKSAPEAEAAGSVYLYEALGSGAGGLLAGLALLRVFGALEIAAGLSALNLIAAAGLVARWRAMAFALAAGAAAAAVAPRIDAWSAARLWPSFRVVETGNSVFGNLAVIEAPGTRSLVENGLVIAASPDPESAEDAVHFALLTHPAPKSMLMIGGGVSGSLPEALRHPSLVRLDYVELDPAVVELARKYFPGAIPADPRLHVHYTDGRLFLKQAAERFDVIIVNLPDPQTAQINRFYTVEFFREAARKLNAGGVFSFSLTGAENYISPELAAFLRCIRKTLGEVFPEVRVAPGETVHFFAAAQPGTLPRGADEFVSRLRDRGLQTQYVREYFIPFRLAPERIRKLETAIAPQPGTPINRDFAPIAYYFDAVLWSSRFKGPSLFERLADAPFRGVASLAAFAAVMVFLALRRRPASIAACAAASMGFTLIGLELLILLAFQAAHGYVYHQLALIIAAVMAGMALGAWRALRSAAGMPALAVVQLAAVAAPLVLYALIASAAQFRWLFPMAALLAGYLGGYQFPVASRVFCRSANRQPGTLYGYDLAGACLGAVALSVFLVPLLGFFHTALLMALVNAAPAALALSGCRTRAR